MSNIVDFTEFGREIIQTLEAHHNATAFSPSSIIQLTGNSYGISSLEIWPIDLAILVVTILFIAIAEPDLGRTRCNCKTFLCSDPNKDEI